MDFTEDEKSQLVDMFKQLGTKPRATNKEELLQWMKEYVAAQEPDAADPADVKPGIGDGNGKPVTVKESIPRIPIFTGAPPTKAEHVPFEVWQYEVNCLKRAQRYSEEAILQAMRLSLRGDASKVAVRLGTEITIDQVLERMNNLYGSISVGEDILAAFYSAHQEKNETVVSWACRLEDLMQQAIIAQKLKIEDRDEALRTKLWSGLRKELRDISGHKYDTVRTFDKLLVELRKLEQDVPNTSVVQDKAKKPVVHSAQAQDDSDLRTLVMQLQSKVKTFEKQSTHKPTQKKIDTITCWKCGQVGHVKAGCRNKSHLNSSRPLGRGTQPAGATQPHQSSAS